MSILIRLLAVFSPIYVQDVMNIKMIATVLNSKVILIIKQ